MEGPTRSGGTRSRSALMPRATTPMPMTWSARPVTMVASEPADRAQTTDPAISGTQETREHPALAVQVAEPAGDGRGDRAGEQGGGDGPGGVGGRRVEHVREVSDEGHDQGLHEGGDDSRCRQHPHPGAGLSVDCRCVHEPDFCVRVEGRAGSTVGAEGAARRSR